MFLPLRSLPLVLIINIYDQTRINITLTISLKENKCSLVRVVFTEVNENVHQLYVKQNYFFK